MQAWLEYEDFNTWEDEGGSVGTPLRRRDGLGRALERTWSRLWIYNETSWSLPRAALVAVCALLLPFFILLAVAPMLLVLVPVAIVAIPLLLPAFLPDAFAGGGGYRRGERSRAERRTRTPGTGRASLGSRLPVANAATT